MPLRVKGNATMKELIPYIPVLALLVLWFLQYTETSKLKRISEDQQRQLDKLYRLLGKEESFDDSTDLPEETRWRIEELTHEGKKIQAIKELRDATGLGLKEAKDYVDGLCR